MIAMLASHECQTMNMTMLEQGSNRWPSERPSAGVRPSAVPRNAAQPNAPDDPLGRQPRATQPLDPDAGARQERAWQAASAAAVQRAFDAWLDVLTTRRERIAAAASLWTAGTLRGIWTRWQLEQRRAHRQRQLADQRAVTVLSRRAVQARIFICRLVSN